MEKTASEIQLEIVNIIRDVLVDLAVYEEVSDEEIAEMEDHFGRVAEFIIEKLGLDVTDAGDGAVSASLNPPDGW